MKTQNVCDLIKAQNYICKEKCKFMRDTHILSLFVRELSKSNNSSSFSYYYY